MTRPGRPRLLPAHPLRRPDRPDAPPRAGDPARSWWSASRAALVVVVGALLVLNGCGLPSKTEPKYAGAAQSAAPPAKVSNPDGPDVATTASALVTNFLEASVGANISNADSSDPPNQEVLDRLRKFMTDAMANRWRPGGDLTVIRKAQVKQELQPGGKYKVTVDVDPIGTLNKSGTFTPAQLSPEKRTAGFKATFTVAPVGSGFRIEDMNDASTGLVLLSEDGFKRWYDWNPIYFWESGPNAKLIPDMRYMPRTLSDVKRVGAVLDALKSGPSKLLAGVVAALPGDYEFQGNSIVKPGSVQINLNNKAAGKGDLSPLARQIRWSLVLHPLVTLTIENQPNAADSERGFNADNVTSQQTAGTSFSQPDKFYVANGVVHSVFPGTPAGDTPLFAAGGQNTQVASAAIDRQFSRAALVRPGNTPASKGKPALWVSSTEMPPAKPPTYLETNVHGTKLSRPAWMTYPMRRVLVIADNVLWIGADDKSANLVRVSLSVPLTNAEITAFAVAPDGHRIALVFGGDVMVASLQFKDGTPAIGQLQPIDTLLGSNEAVDWLTETVLVVGGKPTPEPPYGEKPYSVVAITLDGAASIPLPLGNPDTPQPIVTSLVAQVGDPLEPATQSFTNPPVNVMVEAGNRAQEVFRNEIGPLQLPDPPSSAEPINPTAPFYPD
ncbi:LpqB family beta-propeller domain-containing protein [Dactylosporangium sp. CA-139066]|uniref:LpqB family beta-propeller domain-containing protein n=1 Tax=Dactylosporangium sp. CA-139066 TaxID=3239930 RepID=UPI003D8E5B10